MVLESIMNFERFQFVKINPDNPGTHTIKSKGIVRIIETKIEGFGSIPTGTILVLWNREHHAKPIHYSHLIILKNGTDTSKTIQTKE